jgi:hypothetical protein
MVQEGKELSVGEHEGSGVTSSPRLFIKVKAAFLPDEDNSQELISLGLEAPEPDPEFKPTFINITKIISAYGNKADGVNIITSDGDKWSTEPQSADKVMDLLEQISIDLT